MTTNPADLSATEAARRIDAGSLRPEALMEACLDRIAAREDTVRAFVHLDPALARAAAARPLSGVLAGLPVGVKDVLDTADQPSQYGSPIWHGYQPKADAYAVAATRRAGGVVLGKTVTTEFATRQPGPTTNPHNPAHTPGGSSSGSAAGVAAGFFPLAFGTQTAGSILRPAAYCGITGFKPSHGLIHRAGMKVMSESLDTIGVFGRAAADCALFASALTGLDLGDVPQATGAAPRIALCLGAGADSLTGETKALLDDVAAACSRAGAKVTRIDLPAALQAAQDAHPMMMHGESAQSLAWERASHRQQISEVLNERLDWAEAQPATTLVAARATIAQARNAFQDLMADYDILLTASAPGEAPEGIEWTGDPICNAVWTALQGPCISLPAGTGPAGLPLGVQLVAPFGADKALLGWAWWVEAVVAYGA
ncbi:amidase [Roseomonas aerophila]|uniref:Amidase n=1 Tax=Teichococcus aerophilus TaxID=1224513 RepID=A0ABR7RLU4_9PROT|nr:amidase [Pseudoroseomonas aerophila]MBC9207559.1 amidase [Pseudoroseomonas aerophila]